MTADLSAGLVEEREFLLRSLRDLEAERAAGDIDDHDYETLKRDYTARAASVLRAIESPAPVVTVAPAPAGPRRSYKVPVAIAVVVVLAGLSGWAVMSSSGDRSSGQNITGTPAGQAAAESGGASIPARLAQAQSLFGQGKVLEAIKIYDGILKEDPNQVEALAYRGWLLHLANLDNAALPSLDKAVQADPSYPDAHFFRGEVLCTYAHDQPGAVAEFEAFLKNNPPQEMAPLVQSRLDNAKAGGCAAAKVDFGTVPPGAAPATVPTTAVTAGSPSTTAQP